MSTPANADDLASFETHRAHLIALAYRMLGDMGRAEDMVQDAWLRWSGRAHDEVVASPRAYLAATVTRLCLNELASAQRQKEESRGDRLPEPVDLRAGGLDRLEQLDHVSIAFLFVLQRLTPAERAVLLLHDVFDFEHGEIAALVGKSDAACRKLLERARESVAKEKRLLRASREAHERLLRAFLRAAFDGDAEALVGLLAEDAMIITDGGPEGRVNGAQRNLDRPLVGARNVASFVIQATRRGGAAFARDLRDLNGRPAVVLHGPDGPTAAITLAVDEERIHRVHFHADLKRLGHLGVRGEA